MFTTSENRIQLIGWLGQEIDLVEYQDGKLRGRMSLATHEWRKTEDGKKETVTTWHNLVVWGKMAKAMAEAFSKGQRMYVEGKLSYRQFTDVEGRRRDVTEVVVTDYKRLASSDK